MHSIYNSKFKVLNEILVVFHNGSSYDYHFLIKELANEFEVQFECLGESKEKYKTFSVLIKEEITKINKDGGESIETISYKIKFIDSICNLWEHHCQNLLIISRREFIKLSVKIVVVFSNMLRII